MTIVYQNNQAIFQDVCTVEEADGFLAWMREHAGGEVDLAQCHHIHTAILQIMMAFMPKVVALPEDAFLLRVIQSVLEPHVVP